MQRIFDILPNPLGSKINYSPNHPAAIRNQHESFINKAWHYIVGDNVHNLDEFSTPNQEAEFGYRKLSPEEEEYIIRVHHYEAQRMADSRAAVQDGVFEKVQQKVGDAFEAVKHQSEQAVHQAGETVQHAYESTKERLGEAVDTIKDRFEHISEHAQEKMKAATQKAPEYAQDAYDKGQDLAREAYYKGSEFVKDSSNKGSEYFHDAAETLGDKFEQAKDDISEGASSKAKFLKAQIEDYLPSKERLSELGRKIKPDFSREQDLSRYYAAKIKNAFDPSRYRLDMRSGPNYNLTGSGSNTGPFMPVTAFYASLLSLYFCVLFYRTFSHSVSLRRQHLQKSKVTKLSNDEVSSQESSEQPTKSLNSGVVVTNTIGLESTHYLSSTVSFPLIIVLLGYLELTGSSRLLLNALYIIFIGGWVLRTDILPIHTPTYSHPSSSVSDYGFYATLGVLACSSFLGIWHALGCNSIL